MSDEQIIYIGPEDDLTNVRERLEKVESRQVTLVIPAQTQLRSHVAWKLLHARARELGKDILIVSADPQIRSVAQAVKFRVANSIEAAQESKSRPAARPTRSNAGTRGRATTARGGTRSRQLQPPDQWSPARTEIRQEPTTTRSRFSEAGGASATRSNDYDVEEKPFGQGYDYRIDTSPPIYPLSQEIIDEPDLLQEDFEHAEHIREAASQSGQEADEGEITTARRTDAPAQSEATPYRITPRPRSDDPFAFMEDREARTGRAEQQGRASLHNFDTNQHAIEDISATPSGDFSSGEIEYQGDMGDFVVHSDTPPRPKSHSWTEPTPDDEEDSAGPARAYGVRPRNSRSAPKIPQLPSQQNITQEDDLPPIEERPTRITQQRPSRPLTGAPRSGSLPQRVSKPLGAPPRTSKSLNPAARSGSLPQRVSRPLAPAARSGSLKAAPLDNRTELPPTPERQRPSAPLARQEPARPAAPVAPPRARPGSATAPRPPARPATKAPPKPAQRGLSRGSLITVASVILLFIIVAALAYFVPSADVGVSLPGRAYTHAVQLTLVDGNTNAAGSVSGNKLTHQIPKKGTGTATGTAKVGTNSATGTVIFTNTNTNTASIVRIPTGIVVTTTTGLQFVTTADAVVSYKGGELPNFVEVPVQAVKSGVEGNVAEATVTVIPDESLTTIARTSDIQVGDLKLTVVNGKAITGGGAGNAPAVKQQDLDTAKADLSKQAQADFTAWLKTQIGPGDVYGDPNKDEQFVTQPKVGQVLPAGTTTFPLELNASYTVLVLPQANLQNASRQQLNGFLSKEKSFTNYVMATGAQVKVDKLSIKKNNANQIVNFTATGQAVPNLNEQQVRGLIAGKNPDAARSILQENVHKTTRTGNTRVSITMKPGFIPWIPFKADNIHVSFSATAPTPPAKNT